MPPDALYTMAGRMCSAAVASVHAEMGSEIGRLQREITQRDERIAHLEQQLDELRAAFVEVEDARADLPAKRSRRGTD